MSLRKAALFLVTAFVTIVPHSVIALGQAADLMCNPYFDQCPCNEIPNKDDPKRCVPAGKGSNTHGCDVGICQDTTNGHHVTGYCVEKNKCEGVFCDGKPCEAAVPSNGGTTGQTPTGVTPADSGQTTPTNTGTNLQTGNGTVGPSSGGQSFIQDPFSGQFNTTPTANPSQNIPGISGIQDIANNPGSLTNLPGGADGNVGSNFPTTIEQAAGQWAGYDARTLTPTQVPDANGEMQNSFSNQPVTNSNLTGFSNPNSNFASNDWTQGWQQIQDFGKQTYDAIDNWLNPNSSQPSTNETPIFEKLSNDELQSGEGQQVCGAGVCSNKFTSSQLDDLKGSVIQDVRASTYSERENTAYGGVNDPNQFTAASKEFPNGARVLEYNRATGDAVVAKVNDTGPFLTQSNGVERGLDNTPAVMNSLKMGSVGNPDISYMGQDGPTGYIGKYASADEAIAAYATKNNIADITPINSNSNVQLASSPAQAPADFTPHEANALNVPSYNSPFTSNTPTEFNNPFLENNLNSGGFTTRGLGISSGDSSYAGEFVSNYPATIQQAYQNAQTAISDFESRWNLSNASTDISPTDALGQQENDLSKTIQVNNFQRAMESALSGPGTFNQESIDAFKASQANDLNNYVQNQLNTLDGGGTSPFTGSEPPAGTTGAEGQVADAQRSAEIAANQQIADEANRQFIANQEPSWFKTAQDIANGGVGGTSLGEQALTEAQNQADAQKALDARLGQADQQTAAYEKALQNAETTINNTPKYDVNVDAQASVEQTIKDEAAQVAANEAEIQKASTRSLNVPEGVVKPDLSADAEVQAYRTQGGPGLTNPEEQGVLTNANRAGLINALQRQSDEYQAQMDALPEEGQRTPAQQAQYQKLSDAIDTNDAEANNLHDAINHDLKSLDRQGLQNIVDNGPKMIEGLPADAPGAVQFVKDRINTAQGLLNEMDNPPVQLASGDTANKPAPSWVTEMQQYTNGQTSLHDSTMQDWYKTAPIQDATLADTALQTAINRQQFQNDMASAINFKTDLGDSGSALEREGSTPVIPVEQPIENPSLPQSRPAAADNVVNLAGCGGVCEVGNTGVQVENIQKFLNTQGNDLKVDGVYGSQTESAVEAFQQKNKIADDGIVGPETLAKMNQIAQANKVNNNNGDSGAVKPLDQSQNISQDQSIVGRVTRGLTSLQNLPQSLYDTLTPREAAGNIAANSNPLDFGSNNITRQIADIAQQPEQQSADESALPEQEKVPLPKPRPASADQAVGGDSPNSQDDAAQQAAVQAKRQSTISSLLKQNTVASKGIEALDNAGLFNSDKAAMAAGLKAAAQMQSLSSSLGDTQLSKQINQYLAVQNRMSQLYNAGEIGSLWPLKTQAVNLGRSIISSISSKYGK